MMKYACFGLLLAIGLQPAFAQSTAFTYQGRLSDGAGPANGTYDFEFSAFAAAGGGTPLAGPTGLSGVTVSNGYFVVSLDFGVGIFTGAERWLELGVRTNGGTSFTVLAPRTAVTPTPYALHARNVASGGVVGTHSEGVTFDNPANVFVGTFDGDGAGVTNVNAATLDGLNAAAFWQLGGNAGTIPGANFLGTTDGQPLELKVNGGRAMRLEPAPETPNVIGGVGANSVTPGVRGATIAGGGLPAFPNAITADFAAIGGGTFNVAGAPWATIAGGRDNRARSESSTVAGGFRNSIQTNSNFGTIGGGVLNLIQTNSASATISGGAENVVETNATFAAIGGGLANVNQPHSPYGTIPGGWRNQVGPGSTAATVGGGENNRAAANHATVAGGLNNNNSGPGATIGGGNGNVTLANDTVIGGGFFNTISNNAFSSTISGGREHLIRTGSEVATIGGGYQNTIGASEATISGGVLNQALGASAVIGGGGGHRVESAWATIAGGRDNRINTNATYATVAGGHANLSSGFASSIGGGGNNMIEFGSDNTAIAGGENNRIGRDSSWSFLGSGYQNIILSNSLATLGGGFLNQLGGDARITTVSLSSDQGNTMAGGGGNYIAARSYGTAIGGGVNNTVLAGSSYATIPGGQNNSATNFAFAAGRRAKANHQGAFVWADSQDADFASTGTNQFLIRASGGVGINQNNPTAKLHVGGTPGVDGIRFPDGTLQTTAATPLVGPQVVFSSGLGNDPAPTNNFLSTPVSVEITSSSQKILVTAHKAFGSTAAGGANALNLYIGHRPQGGGSITTVGGGVLGNQVAQNTRITMGLSGMITGLAPGTYLVGLVGNSGSANWNSNEYSYTTAVLY